MYVSYCASCHGVDGRGHGPAASALKVPPADLTLLSKNNQDKFPAYHLDTVLKFGSEMPAHGSAGMPVWGPMLTRLDPNDHDHSKEALRISNLAHYIETTSGEVAVAGFISMERLRIKPGCLSKADPE